MAAFRVPSWLIMIFSSVCEMDDLFLGPLFMIVRLSQGKCPCTGCIVTTIVTVYSTAIKLTNETGLLKESMLAHERINGQKCHRAAAISKTNLFSSLYKKLS
jgi:hypothetical protein